MQLRLQMDHCIEQKAEKRKNVGEQYQGKFKVNWNFPGNWGE